MIRREKRKSFILFKCRRPLYGAVAVKSFNRKISRRDCHGENEDFSEYLMYCSKNDGWIYIFEYLYVWLISFIYFMKYNPKVIVSTGVHSTIPMCVYGRLFGRKVIYIETVANVHSPSMSGKLMYKIATDFYIQWEELLEVYPNAIVGGCLF